MLQSEDGEKNLFKNIILNINLCDIPEYRQSFDKFVKQILIHEIAHYLYFFKDWQTERFQQICRSNGENSCQFDDFVSTYAMQGQEEDYAESFADRYLQRFNHSAMIVDQGHESSPETRMKWTKLQYFDVVYGQ